MKLARAQELLRGIGGVIHVGADAVAAGARAAGVPVYKAEIAPPAGGDTDRLAELAALRRAPLAEAVRRANLQAVARMLAADPALAGLGPAGVVVPGMTPDLVLHAGPKVAWADASPALRRSAIAAVRLEKRAATNEEAAAILAQGRMQLAPGFPLRVAIPDAGTVTASTPVWMVADRAGPGDRHAFAPLLAGCRRSLRYGCIDEAAVETQRRLVEVAAPALARVFPALGPVTIVPLVARALTMGDEGHGRTTAVSSLLFQKLAPALSRTAGSRLTAVLEQLSIDEGALATPLLAAARLVLSSADGVPCSSLVTALSSNGAEYGLQIASLPGRWFTAPVAAVAVDGKQQAAPEMGDGSMLELVGLGAFALAAAPALGPELGLKPDDMVGITQDMARVTLARSQDLLLPSLAAGASVGLDLCLVLELNLAPAVTGAVIDAGGEGLLGLRISRAPWACFAQALPGLLEHCRSRVGV